MASNVQVVLGIEEVSEMPRSVRPLDADSQQVYDVITSMAVGNVRAVRLAGKPDPKDASKRVEPKDAIQRLRTLVSRTGKDLDARFKTSFGPAPGDSGEFILYIQKLTQAEPAK